LYRSKGGNRGSGKVSAAERTEQGGGGGHGKLERKKQGMRNWGLERGGFGFKLGFRVLC